MGRTDDIFEKLWFAEKFVSLLIEQHLYARQSLVGKVVICWKIRIFAYWTTPSYDLFDNSGSCDLLKNSYLCLLNNTLTSMFSSFTEVVICWKIRIFAYWTTPRIEDYYQAFKLWFAEKFVSLLIEQHPLLQRGTQRVRCDLLKNSYLCLLNNTWAASWGLPPSVVICWKIRIFAYWTTPNGKQVEEEESCDLLKNSYLCLLNNTTRPWCALRYGVVICWKIRIFAYWTTPGHDKRVRAIGLWFAEKFVSLLIEQHQPNVEC